MADEWRGGPPRYDDDRDDPRARSGRRGARDYRGGPGWEGRYRDEGEDYYGYGRSDRERYARTGWDERDRRPSPGEFMRPEWSAFGGAGGYREGWGPYNAFGQQDRDYRGGGRPERDYRRGEERDWWDRAGDEISSWFGDEDAERRREQDRRAQHRGRGPRGYTRSDERIREDVHDHLTDDPYLDASDISVEVSGGEVTLNGTVDSRYAKRRAEDIVDDIMGVSHCQNNLRVRRDDQRVTQMPRKATATRAKSATSSRRSST